ncbi:calcium/calmodulin-dependent protein kinase type IV-like [Cyanistes caeruleus]|uniref:calcium/calmodulin-dependent protein kinase type IV-like n=1 Tax=Cyanistes caeruleus TaxID=156563 RepID=UPI000CDAF232|nr:calcium/calmodulin-dependent protein kinase type IV-like [Cyanistes caeruleus]
MAFHGNGNVRLETVRRNRSCHGHCHRGLREEKPRAGSSPRAPSQNTRGGGATSVVFSCQEKGTGAPYAAKILKKTIDKKIVRTEIGVLLRLSHPNIIKLKEIFETPSEIALVLELVTGGELFDRIVERGFYSERDAAHVVKQILEAVSYLHQNGVVHRDLKPENLLYADLSPDAPLKIGDFGLSKIVDEQDTMKTVCGTPGYCGEAAIPEPRPSQHLDLNTLELSFST